MADGESHDRTTDADSTLPYQPIHHAPPRKTLRAIVTGFAGVVSVFIGGGLGVIAVTVGYTGDGIACAVCAVLAVAFLGAAWILFRQANELWGWVG